MTKPSPLQLLLLVSGTVLGLLLIAFIALNKESPEPQPKPVADAELGTGKVDIVYGGDGDDFAFKQVAYHPDNSIRVIKTVFDNRHSRWLVPTGNIVFYKYYRTDGTAERSRLVFPTAMLGASVMTKEIEKIYSANGLAELEERYIRADGTLGVLVDNVKKTFTTYRSDGKTLRSIQHIQNGELLDTHYRLDGKTIWWETNYHQDNCQVHFDLNGNPYEKVYEYTSLIKGNGFSMNEDSEPIPLCYNTYKREDNTAEYRQTWAECWDHNLDTSREILTELEVYAEDGKTVLTRATLKADADSPTLIEKVEHFNQDGTSLVRTYQSPGCRLSEETFDADGKSVTKETFPKTDSFKEELDERLFHGIGRDTTGTYDDDSHDV